MARSSAPVRSCFSGSPLCAGCRGRQLGCLVCMGGFYRYIRPMGPCPVLELCSLIVGGVGWLLFGRGGPSWGY